MSSAQLTTNEAKHASRNPMMRYAIANLHRTVRALLPDQIESVLEVGVGEGYSTADVLRHRPNIRSVGGDLNIASVLEARQRFPAMHYAMFDATHLPYADHSVDTVFSLEVLEHIPQPERALQEMIRVTRKYVLISVPNEPMFRIQRLLSGKGLRMWGDHPEHVNHWSFQGIQRFLTSNDLHILTAYTPPPFAWSVVLCQTTSF